MKKKVIVAGHICIDITPVFPAGKVRKLTDVMIPGKTINTEEAVVNIAGNLISAMPKEEKEKFIKLTSQMNINGKAKTSEFLIKIAKGELKLQPDKKPPVVHKKQEEPEYDIF